MKYANKLTKENLKEFLKSINVQTKTIECNIPNSESYVEFSKVVTAVISTDRFNGIKLYFNDLEFRFGTTPNLYEDKKLTKAWREFLAKTFKTENYVNYLQEELDKKINELKQEKEEIK